MPRRSTGRMAEFDPTAATGRCSGRRSIAAVSIASGNLLRVRAKY
jgi:hypothetical protein